MRFKLDENFGKRTQHIFITAGHNVRTVYEQSLQGCSDKNLYDICCKESRCLVTLDLDFSDTIRFEPSRGSGIAVIRVTKNPSLKLLEKLIKQFLDALEKESIDKKLWIIEVGRIRIHQSENEYL